MAQLKTLNWTTIPGNDIMSFPGMTNQKAAHLIKLGQKMWGHMHHLRVFDIPLIKEDTSGLLKVEELIAFEFQQKMGSYVQLVTNGDIIAFDVSGDIYLVEQVEAIVAGNYDDPVLKHLSSTRGNDSIRRDIGRCVKDNELHTRSILARIDAAQKILAVCQQSIINMQQSWKKISM